MYYSGHRNPSVPPSVTTDGVLVDTCVHDIDVSRWLLDAEVVSAQVLSPRRSSRAADHLQDPLLLLLEMANGVLVDVEAAVNIAYGYDIRGEVARRDGHHRAGRERPGRGQARGPVRRAGARATGGSGSSAPTTSSSRSGSTRSRPGARPGRARGTATRRPWCATPRVEALHGGDRAGVDARAAGPVPATAGTARPAPTDGATTMVKIALDPAMYHARPVGGRRGAQGRRAGLRVPGAVPARGLVLLAPLPQGRRRRRSPRCSKAVQGDRRAGADPGAGVQLVVARTSRSARPRCATGGGCWRSPTELECPIDHLRAVRRPEPTRCGPSTRSTGRWRS